MVATNHTTLCPDCGASNSAGDLFCQHCGASLAAVGPANDQTNAFTPVSTVNTTQTTAVSPAVAPQGSQSYPIAEQPTGYTYAPAPESSRGAVLGWLAATLMLLIVGFFLWSSVITESTRDRFTGWF